VLENRNVNDEERIVQLEKELEETIMHGEESDRKFEEVTVGRQALWYVSSVFTAVTVYCRL